MEKITYDGTTPIPLDTPLDQIDVPMLRKTKTYKPFQYPWAEEFEDRQQSVHWMARELPMGEDLKDWAPQSERLTDGEREFLKNIFRLFTQSDIDVNENYEDNIISAIGNGEIKRMLTVFNAFETIHIKAYSYVLESLKLPESTYHEFLDIEEMRAKHEHLKTYKSNTLGELLYTLACFSSFVEGLQLFASFAMLLNFPRHGRMRQMGQIVSWSIRDESIHVMAGQKMYHQLREECGIPSSAMQETITEACRNFVKLEDAFIDRAFEFEIRGLTPKEVKSYVRFIADMRLYELGFEPIYGILEHPLPWIDELTGHEHANFFETRATEYSKAAFTGTWEGAWDALDAVTRAGEPLVPADIIHDRQIKAGIAETLL